MHQLAKLRWQCRRGTKELDLLLQRYLDSGYLLADDEEKALFVELLELEDDELEGGGHFGFSIEDFGLRIDEARGLYRKARADRFTGLSGRTGTRGLRSHHRGSSCRGR